MILQQYETWLQSPVSAGIGIFIDPMRIIYIPLLETFLQQKVREGKNYASPNSALSVLSS